MSTDATTPKPSQTGDCPACHHSFPANKVCPGGPVYCGGLREGCPRCGQPVPTEVTPPGPDEIAITPAIDGPPIGVTTSDPVGDGLTPITTIDIGGGSLNAKVVYVYGQRIDSRVGGHVVTLCDARGEVCGELTLPKFMSHGEVLAITKICAEAIRRNACEGQS